MNRKAVSGIMLTLLISMLTFGFNIQPVESSGTIYIRADGSIEPSTANITSVDNVTYTFTDNNYDSIVVERDNIVLDGAGYTLQGTGSGWIKDKGIDLTGRSNVTIENVGINAFHYGIWFSGSSNNSISGNNITDNYYGIHIYESSNNSISGNNITANEYGILFYDYSNYNNITRNSLANKEYSILLWQSSDNTIYGNTITDHYDYGIWLENSSDNTIYGNDITSNDDSGIYLYSSDCNAIYRNNIAKNQIGVLQQRSSNNTISDNIMTNNEKGIHLSDSRYNTISVNTITNNDFDGVYLFQSSVNTVSGNNMTENGCGIYLKLSFNNIFSGNSMNGNEWNLDVFGSEPSHFMNSIDASNLVNGKSVYYLVNQSDLMINCATHPQIGYLAFINCDNVTVEGLTLTNNGQGLLLAYTNNSRMTDNTIRSNHYGIYFECSSNNTVSRNNITENKKNGIMLHWSSNNTVSGSNLTANGYCGLSLSMSFNNTVSRNNLIVNNDCGIRLWESSNNKFHHNNFVNNTQQVLIPSPGYANVWDDGYPSGGNYWSDYIGNDTHSGPFQNETGCDGIGDTPYVVDANNQDNYPLMIPWGYLIGYESNTTITNVTVTKSTLDFETSGPEGTIGYINVTMPVDFNTTAIKVFVDDVELTPPPFPIIATNSTHYFIYFEFNQSTHYITIQYAIVDIAINNVTLSKTVVGQGYFVNISVTVENRGNFTETFDVSVFYDETAVTLPDGKNHTTTTLTSGNSTTITIPWNTTGVAVGHYVISAKATPVLGETDTTDNTFINGVVTIILRPGGLACARRGVCPCYY